MTRLRQRMGIGLPDLRPGTPPWKVVGGIDRVQTGHHGTNIVLSREFGGDWGIGALLESPSR